MGSLNSEMPLTANKTTKATPIGSQKITDSCFFRKAGEGGFFSTKENSSFFNAAAGPKLAGRALGDLKKGDEDAATEKMMDIPKFGSLDNSPDKREERLQAKQEIPRINFYRQRIDPGEWIARTPQNGCTPRSMGVADPDRILEQQIAQVAGTVDTAIHLLQVRLSNPRSMQGEEQDRIDFFFACPTDARLREIVADFVRLRAILEPNLPYQCIARASSGSMTSTVVPEYGVVPTGLSVSPNHFNDLDVLRSNILGVGIRLIGVADYYVVYSYHRYVRRQPHGVNLCRQTPNRGTPPPPVVYTPEPGEVCQPAYIFLNDDVHPTSWSHVARSGHGHIADRTCHTMNHPPNFVRLRGDIPFNLNPDGTVTPRSISTAAHR